MLFLAKVKNIKLPFVPEKSVLYLICTTFPLLCFKTLYSAQHLFHFRNEKFKMLDRDI